MKLQEQGVSNWVMWFPGDLFTCSRNTPSCDLCIISNAMIMKTLWFRFHYIIWFLKLSWWNNHVVNTGLSSMDQLKADCTAGTKWYTVFSVFIWLGVGFLTCQKPTQKYKAVRQKELFMCHIICIYYFCGKSIEILIIISMCMKASQVWIPSIFKVLFTLHNVLGPEGTRDKPD